MEHPAFLAIVRSGFTPLGWFRPDVGDGVDATVACIVLVGNLGPEMFHRFMRDRWSESETLDDWTRRVIELLSQELGAQALYPFERPYPPILCWARRAGVGYTSPLGLNIHPVYGLWHAFRAALLFPMSLDLPSPVPSAHPCESCVAKPCLDACPVRAFTPRGYDASACVAALATDIGHKCMSGGCLARHACPVGQEFAYETDQAQFHMRAFVASMRAREPELP